MVEVTAPKGVKQMTLDDAIKHCQKVAKESDCECANEHKQLAEWLKELKKFKQKQTNEEWFDGLSTKEKAKVFANATYSSAETPLSILWGGKEAEQKKWEMWLKQPHGGE